MKLNTLNLTVASPLEGYGRSRTHEGGLAVVLTPEQALRRAEPGGFDRVIVLTDEQSHDNVVAPVGVGGKAYLVNVANAQHGVGYGLGWQHVDGFSEAVVEYIRALETTA